MRKQNLLVFIALLPIAIQAENHEFSLGQLFELHKEQRISHELNELKLDSGMSTLATKLASKLINNESYNIYQDKNINKNYKINVYQLNYCVYDENSKLSSKTVFNQWLIQETFINDNNETIELPTKILCKYTNLIGLGYEVSNEKAAVVALYHPNDKNC